ncbi:MAG: response regulator [Candidatus Binatia bacterium]
MPGRILIVEDHKDSREILAAQLRHAGYEVIKAETGSEAIEIAKAQEPNLIIMDLGLPGMNGIETTVKLKENTKTARIPVVAYTAWDLERYKKTAEKAGFEGYLTKPASLQVLKQTIEGFLKSQP